MGNLIADVAAVRTRMVMACRRRPVCRRTGRDPQRVPVANPASCSAQTTPAATVSTVVSAAAVSGLPAAFHFGNE